MVFKFERNAQLVSVLRKAAMIFVNIAQFSFSHSCSYWSTLSESTLGPKKSKYSSLLHYRLSGFTFFLNNEPRFVGNLGKDFEL